MFDFPLFYSVTTTGSIDTPYIRRFFNMFRLFQPSKEYKKKNRINSHQKAKHDKVIRQEEFKKAVSECTATRHEAKQLMIFNLFGILVN
jgi:hypothetical protein